MSATRSKSAALVRLVFIALFVCIVTAIVIQNHTKALPLGLFNVHRALVDVLANFILLVSLTALVVLVLEFSMSRSWPLAGVIRGAAVFFILLEIFVRIGDRLIITGNATGGRGVHYEEHLADGTPVIMRRTHGGTPVDFCASARSDSFRVLFLGDSYTEGSGRGPECNYTDVVERQLRLHWRDRARVINAGVNSSGPVESLHLLNWYRERGCRFEAVVYNLFLENDFTDNLPETERRVTAGVLSRFPSSLFLRTFHPLNTWAFRWSSYVVAIGRVARGAEEAVSLEPGQCNPVEERLGELTPFFRSLIEYRLSGSDRVASTELARRPAIDAVQAMRETARQLDVPFVLVIFPDRVLVDSELRERMSLEPNDVAAPRRIHSIVSDLDPHLWIVDTTDVLDGRVGMYRRSDTHLSDLGNQVTGRYVANALAKYFADNE